MSKLPNKKSELIRVAINDLELCENDDRYEIDMDTWHKPCEYVCQVCLAGSVMAKSLNANIDNWIDAWDYSPKLNEKLSFLNDVRLGLGLINYNFGTKTDFKHRPTPYETNPKLFKQQMLDLADILEVEGY